MPGIQEQIAAIAAQSDTWPPYEQRRKEREAENCPCLCHTNTGPDKVHATHTHCCHLCLGCGRYINTDVFEDVHFPRCCARYYADMGDIGKDNTGPR